MFGIDTKTFLLYDKAIADFFPLLRLSIMVKYTTKQWDDKFSAKPSQITLVDQEKKNGKELNKVWNVMKRFVNHPANEDLPAVHHVVKGFAVCVSRAERS